MHQRRHPHRDSGPGHAGDPATRLSRFLALVLRHRAHQFDLDVDEEGFVAMDRLMEVIRAQTGLESAGRDEVEALAREGDRRRYEIRGDRIRATYGHSFRRPIRYETVEPPEVLFVGVTNGQLQELRHVGLRPEGRQYVHLSETQEEALEVATRRGEAATAVTVRAREASLNGIAFHHPAKGLYLAAQIPARYLDIEVRYGRRPRKARRRI